MEDYHFLSLSLSLSLAVSLSLSIWKYLSNFPGLSIQLESGGSVVSNLGKSFTLELLQHPCLPEKKITAYHFLYVRKTLFEEGLLEL